MGDLAQQLDAALRAKNYPRFLGKGEMTIVYVEGMNVDGTLNANTPNEFNDLRCVLTYEDGKPVLVGKWEGTTEPGRYWTEHPMNPGGAARIAPNAYRAWQVGMHHSHEALIQTGGTVTVYRDLNRDYKRAGDKLDTGMFGINQHGGYDMSKSDLGRSSAGCLVGRSMAGHQQFMKIMKSDPRYEADHAFIFSASVLLAADVVTSKERVHTDTVAEGPSSTLISVDAINLIVNEEVSGRPEYERSYTKPTWPGGQSGVTIGIGYDIGTGVASKAQLQRDWEGELNQQTIETLSRAIGVTGEAAQSLARSMAFVNVSWDSAMRVFTHVDIPKWFNTCKKVLPNYESLHPDCRGALLSLAYNRGASFSDQTGDDRFREMRNIHAYMETKAFAKIPNEIRSMKRIWAGKGLDGLLARREREAVLFERGLKKPRPMESVLAGGTVVAGGALADGMVEKGYNHWLVGGIVVGAVVIGVVVYQLVRKAKGTV